MALSEGLGRGVGCRWGEVEKFSLVLCMNLVPNFGSFEDLFASWFLAVFWIS